MIRSTAVLGITLSTLLSISCTSSPRSFDDAGSPDAGDDDAIPGWRLAWAVRAGGDEHELSPAGKVRETGQSIAALSDGSSYLGGQVAESAVFGPGESNEAHFPDEFVDWSDGFVARYYPDGSLEWVRRVGGNGEDHVFAVVALEDGSVLVAGWFRSDLIVLGEGEPNETSLTTEYGHTTGFVAKFEPDGAIAWATQIPTTEETRMDTRNVDALPDGRILVSGSLRGTAWPGEPFEIVSETSDSPFEWDGYLAWFDANGTVEHAIRIGNDSHKTNHSIAMLPDGSVIAAMPYGYSELFGKGEPNETTLYCPLQQDANDCSSLARYDAEGRLAWVRDLGVTKNGHWYAQTVAGGSVAVIGYFRALTDPELNGADLSIDDDEIGVLVAQYDIEDGHLEWARPVKIDEPMYWDGIGITALPEGGFLAHFKFGPSLAFEGDDPGQRDLVAEGEEDVALVRFSATGEILWMHGMGGTEREMVYGGAQMDGMSIWLTGAYGSDPFVATSGHGDDIELPLTDSIWDDTSDIFLMRFDKVGPPTE